MRCSVALERLCQRGARGVRDVDLIGMQLKARSEA